MSSMRSRRTAVCRESPQPSQSRAKSERWKHTRAAAAAPTLPPEPREGRQRRPQQRPTELHPTAGTERPHCAKMTAQPSPPHAVTFPTPGCTAHRRPSVRPSVRPPHLHRRFVGLQFDGQGLPHPQLLHVSQGSALPVHPPRLAALLGVLGLQGGQGDRWARRGAERSPLPSADVTQHPHTAPSHPEPPPRGGSPISEEGLGSAHPRGFIIKTKG